MHDQEHDRVNRGHALDHALDTTAHITSEVATTQERFPRKDKRWNRSKRGANSTSNQGQKSSSDSQPPHNQQQRTSNGNNNAGNKKQHSPLHSSQQTSQRTSQQQQQHPRQQQNLQQRKENNYGGAKPKIQCYYCKKMGHKEAECRKKKRDLANQELSLIHI